jgi:transcription-repair coupling factor (superfamily II helicase)
VRVAGLSRFLSAREDAEVRAAAGRGEVDVLVGTVALLGRETRFARLDLAVIDEEHRFGVRQKARLTRLREGVDVLSMSATPIPRTLQMALTDVLDVSVIHSPPPDRLSVRTLVAPLTESRVRDVIEAERARGGQVFAIHNRIASLADFASFVASAAPEARIGVAHGQMEPSALESVLVRFVERELDVLVCTSIVESGVDLPNVNGLIVDGADGFGLAQLHQLRGRVGRSGRRATALFGVPEVMTGDARRRLRVLEEHTGIGSGFRIAAADLEIRGGGNLLGVDQSGQVAEVGWETFVELLAEAVTASRGAAEVERLEPVVEVSVPAFVPDALVPDVSERLAWYRRLSASRTDAEVESVLDDLEREIGVLPDPVRNLGGLVATRLRCRALGVARCSWLKVRVVLELHPSSPLRGRLAGVLAAHPRRFALRPGPPETLELRFTPAEAEHPFRLVRWALARLADELRDTR